MSKHILPEYERRSALRALQEYNQDYLGLAELATVCGVNKTTASNWRKRGHTPKADRELAMGPVWSKDTIHAWLLK